MPDKYQNTIELECPECHKTAEVKTDIKEENLLILIGCCDGHKTEDMI